MEQIALTIHLGTLLFLIPIILYTDAQGLLWVRGVRSTLPLRTTIVLHRLVILGLVSMITSGGIMFLTYQDYLLTVPVFYVKMGFVATLVVNAFFIGRVMHIASTQPFASLSRNKQVPLLISGVVSVVCWIGAIVSATLLGL